MWHMQMTTGTTLTNEEAENSNINVDDDVAKSIIVIIMWLLMSKDRDIINISPSFLYQIILSMCITMSSEIH